MPWLEWFPTCRNDATGVPRPELGCIQTNWVCPIWLGLPPAVWSHRVGHVVSTDLTNEQWTLLEPVFNAPGKQGPSHAADLWSAVDEMLCISHTGCQWHFLPEPFVPWTQVLSKFRR